jgi:hypothetical protein
MWARRRGGDRSSGQPCAARPEQDRTIGEILGRVRELRLHLAADLSAAAGALDEGAPSVAADFVEADRQVIDDFVRRARACLEPAATEPAAAPAAAEPAAAEPGHGFARQLVSTGRVLAAAAACLALAAVLYPVQTSSTDAVAGRPVAESWEHFSDIARSDASAAQVIAAADQLHESLADLIAEAGHDPAKMRQALHLLELERQLVLRDRPAGASVVLAQSQALLAQLAALLPTGVPGVASAAVPKPSATLLVVPTAKGSPAPSPAAAPEPSASPSAPAPAPAPAPTSSTPASSPSPSPSDINPIPTAPSVPH